MGTIKLSLDQIRHVSKQVDQARQQLEGIFNDLTGQIMFIQFLWMGTTQERFYVEFKKSKLELEEALRSMVEVAVELRSIADRFENLDKMAVTLGVVTTLAVAGVVPFDPEKPEDKGYRMEYNSAWGMRLPVDKNGETNQAALQAYKRDKGNLDIRGMQSEGIVEEPEEDFYSMQIEAFEERIHPITGEPVSDSYAEMMIASLTFGQVVMSIQGIRGSMPGRKGPYRMPPKDVAKIKSRIEAARARKQQVHSPVPGGVPKSVFENGRASIETFKSNPKVFSGKSAEEIAKMLDDAGYGVIVQASKKSRSGAKIIKIQNTGGEKNITQVQVSPGGGRHGVSPYVKISTNDQGIIKIVDGSENVYKTDGAETATIIFTGRE